MALDASRHAGNPARNRLALYQPTIRAMDWSGTSLPLSVADLPVVEAANKLRIFAFSYLPAMDHEFQIVPLYTSPSDDPSRRTADILLMHDEEGEPRHWCAILDLGKLVGVRSGYSNKSHVCRRCLWRYPSCDALAEHAAHCSAANPGGCVARMPAAPANLVRFDSHELRAVAPYVVHLHLGEEVLEDGAVEVTHADVAIEDDNGRLVRRMTAMTPWPLRWTTSWRGRGNTMFICKMTFPWVR
jgi:hypothetical protein